MSTIENATLDGQAARQQLAELQEFAKENGMRLEPNIIGSGGYFLHRGKKTKFIRDLTAVRGWIEHAIKCPACAGL